MAARGLDHVVHAVRDLDAAAARYRQLGFTVGARNRHPWGTHNRIVQLPGFFVELLTMAEPEKMVPHAAREFSFSQFNQDFLAKGEGLSMLVLAGHNAAGDADEFRSGGLGDFEPFHFERQGSRPDGTSVKVAFTLSFAVDPKAPDVGFFTCYHHYPENFWSPAFQQHRNTAAAIAGVVLVAENPADHHIFLSAFVGERELSATSTGITVQTARGEIQVMDLAAFERHFGTPAPDIGGGARLAALRLVVQQPEVARRVLRDSGIDFAEVMGRLVIAPDQIMGATIAFESA